MKDEPFPTMADPLAEMKGKRVDEIINEVRNEPWEGPHLISVDSLRDAGALDVPPSWRKSLGGGELDLFSDFTGEDENPEKQQPAKVEPDLMDEARRS